MKIMGAELKENGRSRPYQELLPLSISELELEDPGPIEVLVRSEPTALAA